MPSRVDTPLREAEPTDPDIEHVAEGFDDSSAWKKVRFRGVTYKLVELPIGVHQDIEKKATSVKEAPDGSETETVDSRLQNRLMMERSIVEPSGVRVGQLGTRLYLNLQRVMWDLHYSPEIDELREAKAKRDKVGDPEEGDRPNA